MYFSVFLNVFLFIHDPLITQCSMHQQSYYKVFQVLTKIKIKIFSNILSSLALHISWHITWWMFWRSVRYVDWNYLENILFSQVSWAHKAQLGRGGEGRWRGGEGK